MDKTENLTFTKKLYTVNEFEIIPVQEKKLGEKLKREVGITSLKVTNKATNF